MSQSETPLTDAACESPRDCKHGRLARSCEICDLERDSELLHKGGVIEIAVRNPSVSGYMSHWEGRATAAESSLTSCREALERAEEEIQELAGKLYAEEYKFQAAERRAEAMEKALLEISRTDGCTLEHMRNIASAALAKEAK